MFRCIVVSLRRIKWIILSVFLIPQYANGEYEPEILAEYGGAYIFATQLMLSLSESECGYAFKERKYNLDFDSAVADVGRALRGGDRLELQSFLDGDGFSKIKKESAEIIHDQLYGFMRSGIDKKTACGMVISSGAITLDNAKKRWVRVRKLYSQ